MEESYIGSLISLISNYDIRYEGVVSHLSIPDSTISLKNVKIYGTEGRRKDGPQVPPSDKVFDLVLFRGSDIKDLRIKLLPTSSMEEQMYNDPALFQSQCAGVSSLPSVPESGKFVMAPALMSQTSSTALPSFASPSPRQSYNGNINNRSYAPQQTTATSSSYAVQNQKASGLHFSPVWGLVNESESVAPIPPASSPLIHNLLPTETPFTFPTSVDMPSSSSVKSRILTHTACTNNQPVSPSTPLPHRGMNTIEVQPMPSALSGIGVSHLPPPHPSLLSLNKQAQLKPPVISSTQQVDTNGNYKGFLQYPSCASRPLIPAPTAQAPLLPLPNIQPQLFTLKDNYSSTHFTEKFDFEAVNEKFKKDEVWSNLQKQRQRTSLRNLEENATDRRLVAEKDASLEQNVDPKPAYKKDDFFDTISCDSLAPGRNGKSRFSEQIKLDTQAFGNIHPKLNLCHGGFDAGYGRDR